MMTVEEYAKNLVFTHAKIPLKGLSSYGSLYSFPEHELQAVKHAIQDCQNTIEGIKKIIGNEKYMWTSHEKDTIDFYSQVIEHLNK